MENKRTRSGLESTIIKLMDSKSIQYKYEPRELKISYEVKEVRSYLPDVVIGDRYFELKGRFTLYDRKKMKLVVEQNPDKDITIILQKDNPIRKGSETKYSDWCNKNNIKWMMVTDFIELINKGEL